MPGLVTWESSGDPGDSAGQSGTVLAVVRLRVPQGEPDLHYSEWPCARLPAESWVSLGGRARPVEVEGSRGTATSFETGPGPVRGLGAGRVVPGRVPECGRRALRPGTGKKGAKGGSGGRGRKRRTHLFQLYPEFSSNPRELLILWRWPIMGNGLKPQLLSIKKIWWSEVTVRIIYIILSEFLLNRGMSGMS